MSRYCYGCTDPAEPEGFCEVCQQRFCDKEACAWFHRDVHERILWHRRMDELTSDPVKWGRTVDALIQRAKEG